MFKIFAGAGVIFFLYYLLVVFNAGITAAFSLIWLFLAALCEGIAFGGRYMAAHQIKLPVGIYWCVGIVIALVLIFFISVEIVIIRGSFNAPPDDVDYMIVLGAQVRGEQPSRILRERIKTAAEYLKDHPDTLVIVSGGQGPGEDITEAECMKRSLVDLGIEESRILLEASSTDTFENIEYSLEICGKACSVVIVTCRFHTYRAQELAKKAGAAEVYALPSPDDPVLFLNYYVREFFAVIKYKLAGQI